MIFKILYIKKLKIRYQKIEEKIITFHLNQHSITTLTLITIFSLINFK